MLNPFDPMPTIKAILGMPIYEAVKESQILAHLDDFEVPQCESRYHNINTDRHSGAAGFLMQTPCGHSAGYRCTHWIKYVLACDVVDCSECGLRYPPQELTVLPIGGAL